MSNKNKIQSMQQKQPGNTQIPLGITKKNQKGFEAYTFQNSNRAGTPQKRETLKHHFDCQWQSTVSSYYRY